MSHFHLLAVLPVFLIWLKSCESGFLEEVCFLNVDEGRECAANRPTVQHYFDQGQEKCIRFLYKGCGGNVNRFILQDECTAACQVEYFRKKNKNQSGDDEGGATKADCDQQADGGSCKAIIKQWFYDKELGECATFLYGGCNGNKNRFNTEAECKKICA